MTYEEPPVFSTTEARARFDELLERVQKGEHIAITYRGTPSGVLVDMATFEDFLRFWPAIQKKRAGNRQ